MCFSTVSDACVVTFNLHTANVTNQPELKDEKTESDKSYKTHARGHTLLTTALGSMQHSSKDGSVTA